MFAKEDINYLSLDKKWFCEIVSILCLIFSSFVTFVSFRKIKMTITNVLIMQIIMSEILDGINIILAIVIDSYGDFTFENYPGRMGFCLTQIYLGVFSCLWNLCSSLFISIRIFDRMENKNKIFKKKFIYEYATTMSYGIPLIISYILWTWQVLNQSKTLEKKNYDNYYSTKIYNTNYFRYMYCWVTNDNNITLFVLSLLLIIANFYFSIVKSACFIIRISSEIGSKEGEGKNIQIKLKKIKKMMRNLILYPIVSGVVWIIYFILQMIANYDTDKDSHMKHGFGAWLIILIICLRQIVFTLMFFATQGNLRKYAYYYISCKGCKKNKDKDKEDNNENNRLMSKELIDSYE